MPRERDREERHNRGRQNRREQQIARDPEDCCPIGKDEGSEDVERRLLAHSRERRKEDLFGLTFDDLDRRRLLQTVFRNQARKGRRLQYPEPDVETDPDKKNAEKKRDSPSPVEELAAGDLAECESCQIGQKQPRRHTELRPSRDKAAVMVGPRPLHRQQYRAAPLATDSDPLHKAQHRQNNRAPYADLSVCRNKSDEKG